MAALYVVEYLSARGHSVEIGSSTHPVSTRAGVADWLSAIMAAPYVWLCHCLFVASLIDLGWGWDDEYCQTMMALAKHYVPLEVDTSTSSA